MSISQCALRLESAPIYGGDSLFLNNDVLDTILNYVEPSKRSNLRAVSKQFNWLIERKVQAISIKCFPQIKEVQALRNYPRLKELDLSDLTVSRDDNIDALVDALRIVPGIKVLTLRSGKFFT